MRTTDYEQPGPTREEIDATKGALVLEFGTAWCGYCEAAQPCIAAALAEHSQVIHRKIEDGPGHALGRSFRVKLWPTLIVLNDGRELGRVVRPTSAEEVRSALAVIGQSENGGGGAGRS